MVKIQVCDAEHFYDRCKEKKLICFGAGKFWARYASEEFYVAPICIIDNHVPGEKIIDGKRIAICRLDEVLEQNLYFDGIVITSSFYIEILEQLDTRPELDGVECYIPYPFFFEEVSSSIHNRIYNTANVSQRTDRYIIWERRTERFNAAQKAPYDVRRILEDIGWNAQEVHACTEEKEDTGWEKQRVFADWKRISDQIISDNIVVLQHPFITYQKRRRETLTALKAAGVKFVVILHDLERVRKYICSDYFADEEEYIINLADILVVHNKKMKQELMDNGIEEERIVVLGIFDYLCSEKEVKNKEFSKDLIIAGNLDPVKNPHLAELDQLKELSFQLYGAGYDDKKKQDNVSWKGSFLADELPALLPDGFGLVWAGDSLETCSGDVGEYLRYNAPHKLSLYLAAGLPVIIWSGAAMADFVIENEVGFVVSSLYELKDALDRVTEADYKRFAENAAKIGVRLRNGEYTKAAIREAERRLGMSESK